MELYDQIKFPLQIDLGSFLCYLDHSDIAPLTTHKCRNIKKDAVGN